MAGIPWQGLRHDLSKYNLAEFSKGVKYYQGNRSPNDKEREIFGYSLAWLHHKGRNKHHYEYWNDFCPKQKKVVAIDMPDKYIKEMFCDRLAASKIYKKEKFTRSCLKDFFNREKNFMLMHENTKAKLEMLMLMLEEKGSKEVFKYMRQHKSL
jgi:hypothetical protein